jgi:pentatricopeptide repeat protein
MYEHTHKCTAYNALINSCAAVGDVDRAMRVLGQMYDDGLLPDAITYTSLIKTAAAANNADIAEEVSVCAVYTTSTVRQYCFKYLNIVTLNSCCNLFSYNHLYCGREDIMQFAGFRVSMADIASNCYVCNVTLLDASLPAVASTNSNCDSCDMLVIF